MEKRSMGSQWLDPVLTVQPHFSRSSYRKVTVCPQRQMTAVQRCLFLTYHGGEAGSEGVCALQRCILESRKLLPFNYSSLPSPLLNRNIRKPMRPFPDHAWTVGSYCHFSMSSFTYGSSKWNWNSVLVYQHPPYPRGFFFQLRCKILLYRNAARK